MKAKIFGEHDEATIAQIEHLRPNAREREPSQHGPRKPVPYGRRIIDTDVISGRTLVKERAHPSPGEAAAERHPIPSASDGSGRLGRQRPAGGAARRAKGLCR